VPYLTGDSLAGLSYLLIAAPDDLIFRAAITGALLDLCHSWNWEQFGDVSAADASEYFCNLVYNLEWSDTPGAGMPALIGMVRKADPFGVTSPVVIPYDVVIESGIPYDNTDRFFTVPDDGLYIVSMRGRITHMSSGLSFFSVRVNSTDFVVCSNSVGTVSFSGDLPLILESGDKIYGVASGTASYVLSSSEFPQMTLSIVGPL
jgi:hypothetical protein